MSYRNCWTLALTIIIGAAAGVKLPALAAADDPKVATPDQSVKGDSKVVMDLTVTTLNIPGSLLGCMGWADDKGTAFWTLDSTGVIRRISFPDLKETHTVELGKKSLWLTSSAEGLAVSVAVPPEVWLLDSSKFTVKLKIPVPRLERAASALSLSTAFASTEGPLYEIDLKKGKAVAYAGPKPKYGGYSKVVVSPDGKYLFTSGGIEQMNRFAIKNGKASFEQASQRISQGTVSIGIQVTPDSKYVMLPCFPGNYGGKGNLIFPVGDIQTEAFGLLVRGEDGMAISSDPVSGNFYSGGLISFDKEGTKQKEYKLGLGKIQQILAHPNGGKLLVLGVNQGKFTLVLVELPKK